MSGPSERDEIAAIVAADGWYCGEHEHLPEMGECEDCDRSRLHTADAILASDWLAERDRRTAAKTLRRFADSRGVNVGDEDDDYWRGYRQAQRECLHDAINTADRIEQGQ